MYRDRFVIRFSYKNSSQYAVQFVRQASLTQIEKMYLEVLLNDLQDEGKIHEWEIEPHESNEIGLNAIESDIVATLGLTSLEGIGMKKREKTRTVRV